MPRHVVSAANGDHEDALTRRLESVVLPRAACAASGLPPAVSVVAFGLHFTSSAAGCAVATAMRRAQSGSADPTAHSAGRTVPTPPPARAVAAARLLGAYAQAHLERAAAAGSVTRQAITGPMDADTVAQWRRKPLIVMGSILQGVILRAVFGWTAATDPSMH